MIIPLIPLTHVELLELERNLAKQVEHDPNSEDLDDRLMLIGVRHVIAQNEAEVRIGKSDAPQIPGANHRIGYLGQCLSRS